MIYFLFSPSLATHKRNAWLTDSDGVFRDFFLCFFFRPEKISGSLFTPSSLLHELKIKTENIEDLFPAEMYRRAAPEEPIGSLLMCLHMQSALFLFARPRAGALNSVRKTRQMQWSFAPAANITSCSTRLCAVAASSLCRSSRRLEVY